MLEEMVDECPVQAHYRGLETGLVHVQPHVAFAAAQLVKLPDAGLVHQVISLRGRPGPRDLRVAEPRAIDDGVHLRVADRQQREPQFQGGGWQVAPQAQRTQGERVSAARPVAVLDGCVDASHAGSGLDELAQGLGDNSVLDTARGDHCPAVPGSEGVLDLGSEARLDGTPPPLVTRVPPLRWCVGYPRRPGRGRARSERIDDEDRYQARIDAPLRCGAHIVGEPLGPRGRVGAEEHRVAGFREPYREPVGPRVGDGGLLKLGGQSLHPRDVQPVTGFCLLAAPDR